MFKLRIGSRGSPLAVVQTQWVISQLKQKNPNLDIEHIRITTTGDRDQASSLSAMGGKGVFVKEIEEALLAKKIDLAVHSLKDVPQTLPPGLILGPYTEREDCRDAFISRFGELLAELPRGSTIGTSSPRRKAQILNRYKKRVYSVVDIRGNLDTRLKKLEEGKVDAIVVALAGLRRLGLEKDVTQILEADQMVPAPGQGCLAFELRQEDKDTWTLLDSIRHISSDIKARAERAFLQAIGGNCSVPLGLHIEIVKDQLHMTAVLLSVAGDKRVDVKEMGSVETPELVGAKCAGLLLMQGGAELL